ncbi:hypothetical protein P7C71_g6128, partial [Lecanoromycetidae sp. Uapishka_2]
MDGLSAASSVVSLIQAAVAIYDYGCVTYNAKREQRQLSSAVEDLKVKLSLLKQQFERATANPDDPWYEGVRGIMKSAKQFGHDDKVEPDPTEKGPGVLRRMEYAMQRRQDKLSRRQIGCTARPRRLLWYWERKRFEEMITELKQWTNIVDTVCNYDAFTLGLDTNAHVKKGNDRVQILGNDMRIIKEGLGSAAREKERKALERRRIAILAWLSPLKFKERQSALLIQMSTSLSTPTLLTTEEYLAWEGGQHYMLHCEGKPGAGKTLLCAAIIKHLQGVFKAQDIPVLCMYLNYKEQGNQSLDNLVASLLKQLIQHEGAAFRSDKAKELYQGAENESRPTLDDFYEALYEEIQCYERVVIVVDALDEATSTVAPRLMQRLQRLPQDKTSVMVTSQRTESERRLTLQDQCDICERSPLKIYSECHICHDGRFYICNECRKKEKYCEDENHVLFDRKKVMMNIEPTRNDIERYVQAEIGEELSLGDEAGYSDGYASIFDTTPLGRMIKNNPNLRDEIIDIVVEKSDGMFALAALYMKSLRSLGLSEAQILDLLDHQPENYAFFYEQHMQRITSGYGDTGSHAGDLGRKILSWVACTKRPLYLSELQDALAVDLDNPSSFSSSARYDRATIIRVTAGLVTIDNPSERVGLNHQSAQQYFDEHRDRWFPNVEAEITRVALHYLSLDKLSQPCQGEWEDMDFEDRKRDFPFLVYAYQYWGDHAAEAGSDPAARTAVIRYLSDAKTVASSTQASWYLRSDTAADWDVRKGTNGLHICGWFGLTYAISSLLDQESNIDLRDIYGQTPLMYACRKGQAATVANLLGHGANVNESSSRGTCPVFEAVSSKSVEVLKLLLARSDIDVNMPHTMKSKLTALMIAIQQRSLELVKELLNHPKLAVTQKDINGNTALSHTILENHPALTTCVLNTVGHHVALLNSQNWIGQSALILAASEGQVANVNQLMEKGADSSLKDSDGGGTALLRAIDGGFVTTVHTLMKYNADIHCVDDKGRGLLHGAVIGGSEEVVELLLEKGIKPAVVDSNGTTPLHDASCNGHWAIAKTLLDAGADTSLKDNADRTPWTVAWQYGHLSVMRVLEGKEHYERTPEEQLGQYPNQESLPVWSLALFGERDLIADAVTKRKHEIMYLCPENGNTALHCSILSEQHEDEKISMLQMLLNAGMSADAQNDYFRTPLHLAAFSGSTSITKLLLEKGKATVDVKDRWGTTPLLTAYTNKVKYYECALLLIETGAAVPKTKQSMKQSLFFAAIEAGSLMAVANLVQMGADIQAKNVLGYTGLQMAKDEGKADIERYLRRNKSVTGPIFGQSSVEESDEEEEDEDGGEKKMGALTLRNSPFHNPKAWLEKEEDQKHDEEKERGVDDKHSTTKEKPALQQLQDLNICLRSESLSRNPESDEKDIQASTHTIRELKLA